MLKRKRDRVSVQLFQNIYKIRQRGSVIILVGTEYTGKAFFAVKRYPHKLTAVIVQKTRRKTYSSTGGDVGICCIVVSAVKILYFPRAYQPVLYSFKRGW